MLVVLVTDDIEWVVVVDVLEETESTNPLAGPGPG